MKKIFVELAPVFAVGVVLYGGLLALSPSSAEVHAESCKNRTESRALDLQIIAESNGMHSKAAMNRRKYAENDLEYLKEVDRTEPC